jgi:hypothetical protein
MKLFSMDEAAKSLGISVDRLNQVRDKLGIGRRDVGTWKFTEKDMERMAQSLSTPDEDDSVFDSSSDAILLAGSEPKLGAAGSSSTVIGSAEGVGGVGDSDALRSTQPLGTKPDSDVKLVASPGGTGDSDVKLVPGGETGSSQDIRINPADLGDSTIVRVDDGESILPADDTNINLGIEAAKGAGSDLELSSDSVELALGPGLSLDDAPIPFADDKPSSVLDDDELVLSGRDSDITGKKAGDSGIALSEAVDYGLDLDQPLSADSSADEPLELGQDDMLSIADDSDSQVVTDMKPDSDFLLTPLEEVSDADSEDSGSQVIALDEDSGALAESSASFGVGLDQMLQAEGQAPSLTLDPLMSGSGPAPGMMMGQPMQAMGAMAGIPGTRFGVGSVVALTFCTLLLAVCGIMMFDLIRNMWSWDTPYGLNSAIMDMFVS